MEKWKENMYQRKDGVDAFMWNLIKWTDKQVHTLDLKIALVYEECSIKAIGIHKELEEIKCKKKETIWDDEMSMKTSAIEASTKTELVVKIKVFPQILSILFGCLNNIPTKKKSVYILLMFMFYWCTCPANCQIQFEQLTYPIEFGGNATFVCSSVNSDHHGLYAWSKNSEPISRGITSLYPKKYTLKLQMNHTRLYYELTIVAFNYSDLNSFYKCDIDFKSEKRRLSLDEDGFIGKPEVIENNINNEICSLTSPSIILQHAFPRPVCQLHYEGLNYTDYINISSMQEEYAYRIEIEIRKLPCEPNCNGEIDITCGVGIRVYTVIKQKLNGCTGSDVINPLVYVVIIIAVGYIVIHALCNAFLVCKDRLGHRRKADIESPVTEVGLQMLPVINKNSDGDAVLMENREEDVFKKNSNTINIDRIP